MSRCFFTVLVLIIFSPAVKAQRAEITLPALISDNMVLQQNSKALLWGTTNKDEKLEIVVNWVRKKYTVTANRFGEWKTRIQTPGAGGPYQISFKNRDTCITIKNVLIGEIWVCSGQSNMEMPLKGYKNQPVLNGKELIADADRYPGVHIFRVPKVVSAVPLKDCQGAWLPASSATAPEFSAVAYQYAKILHEKLHVPVGIISTYWGGTAIQSWMSENNLRGIPGAWPAVRLDTITDPEKDPERSPSVLFNSMIRPVAGYTVKGFIWYQGESNRFHPLQYMKMMCAMVKEWRALWGSGKLPFYYVQIAPYDYWDPEKEQFAAILREAQLNAMHHIPNAGMVVSLDAGKAKFIHPPDKTIISRRLASWALARTYRKRNICYRSPELKSFRITENKISLKFGHTGGGLLLSDAGAGNFEIAGQDKVFYSANAIVIGRNKVEVYCDKAPKPLAARYAFKNWTTATLYSKDGLPVSSFRTDNPDK